MKIIFTSLFFLLYISFSSAQEIEGTKQGQWSIRTNLTSLAMLAPSLGIEYQVSDKIGFVVDGAIAYWNFKKENKDNYWKLWHFSPKVRNYINPSRNAYLALQFDIGQYNISNQFGNYKGGGIAFGKQYFFSKNTSIDLGLTLGFLQLSNQKKYYQENQVFYLAENKSNKNYWGPTNISINIIRKLNSLSR